MHIAIVGAGYAGVACALRLARRTRGRAKITLVNASPDFCQRIRLHELAAGSAPHKPLLSHLLRGTGVELAIGSAHELDLAAHTLRVGDTQVCWDRLVLALGSQTAVDDIPGVRTHAFTLDGRSAHALAARLPQLAATRGRLLVVGGGLTGIEAASELAELHPSLRVALVTRGELAPELSPRARAHVRTTLERLHVELHQHVEVSELQPHALVAHGRAIPFDACLWTVGFRAPALGADSGLRVNARNQIMVDSCLRALSHPEVYVAGDLAVLRGCSGDALPLGCKTALPSGMHVAESLARELAGEQVRPFLYRAVPYCVSLGRRDGLLEFPAHWRSPPLFGKLAARIKELICRGTIWALAIERRRAAPFTILGRGGAPLLASDSAHS